jgi:hypothetical protein
MMAGNNAKKKLYAIADALVVIEPFTILLQKMMATVYNGTPSRKGKVILFAQKLTFAAKFRPIAANLRRFGKLFLLINSQLMNDLFFFCFLQEKGYPERTLFGSQLANNILCSLFAPLMYYGKFLRLVLGKKT